MAAPHAEAAKCPTNCQVWFDGCNTCQCVRGRVTSCTKKYCKRKSRAYCKKSKPRLTCRNIRCRSPRRCKMFKKGPKCFCPRVAIRCAKGCRVAYKNVGGCKMPYCVCKNRTCPRNCMSWYDGCNTCRCVNGRIAGCTKRRCSRYTRAYCKRRR